MPVGNWLRARRQELRQSPEAIALRAGLSKSHVVNLENGNRKLRNAKVMLHLSSALGVSPSSLWLCVVQEIEREENKIFGR
ncbi:helix-turn-helix domain-containing protein [Amycolatopsis sp. WQ 127309]|nr:helix-turn-helix transcriptional regulator [Amycolatopsis sp. WQ 127309]UOZ11619.1 helix-turn-helix domain-containing protein [Amycolatopsis sp. WQ 127309]